MNLPPSPVAVIGAGRMGTAFCRALRGAGVDVGGPLGRGFQAGDLEGAAAVLLCVPDDAITSVAGAVSSVLDGPAVVGHCSGATPLSVLAPHEGFSVHPLMTVDRPGLDGALAGAPAAIAGATPHAAAVARALAEAVGLEPFSVAEEDRAAYHAAASMASNYLLTLEQAAADLAATAGVRRELLVPLVRRTLENWAAGGSAALTGPAARGDSGTLARQRAAVAERAPGHLALFDALTQATRALAKAPR